jgi:septal ring factor EnvC (AmiA/AmiB activator)
MGEQLDSSEFKVLCVKLDALTQKVDELKARQDKSAERAMGFVDGLQREIADSQKQTALLEKSIKDICATMAKMETRLDRNDILTKIVAAVAGVANAVVVLIIAYLAARS